MVIGLWNQCEIGLRSGCWRLDYGVWRFGSFLGSQEPAGFGSFLARFLGQPNWGLLVCGTELEMGSGEVDADVVEDLIRCSSSDVITSSRDL